MMRRFPPFELEASPTTFAALHRLSGVALGGRPGTTWLRDLDGKAYPIHVTQRDLEFKFEVFSLAIPTMAALAERVALWVAPDLPADLPDIVRHAMVRRPELPIAPSDFEPWPFEKWTVEVLRRAEFIVEDVEVHGALGEAPIMQSAAPPGEVPAEASASCEVAVGLLFTGEDGSQLLIGADWFPFDTIVTRDAAQIEAFRQLCESVRLEEYIDRIGLPINDR
jgi:hypothetical protein